MTRLTRRLLAALMLCAAHATWAAPADDCRRDLDELPGFMLENDAGGKDLLERQGAAHLDDALTSARTAAAAIHTDDDCGPILAAYLRAWRSTHLWIEPASNHATAQQATGTGDDPRLPTLRVLSRRTVLLTLRSFNAKVGEALVALLTAQRRVLESHPDWIVDVRDNNGGMDFSFQPLMPWLVANGSVAMGVRVHVTPANIAGWQKSCDSFTTLVAECQHTMGAVVQRMQAARPGDDVSPYHDGNGITYTDATAAPGKRPARVAILIDKPCGSSCEEFLLEARQGFAVKLVGRRTYGGLDYSNLRPHELPSGHWRLWYATTRSLRIPDLPVDGIGVLPDIYLPLVPGDTPADEIERTRRWLEGGTLAPLPH